MDVINAVIASLALILGGINSYFIYKHGKKKLDLDILRLQAEFGTIEDIDAEIRNLQTEHQKRISKISKKWNEEQSKRASDLASRRMSRSSEADNMIREVNEGRKSELEAEERNHRLKLQKLHSIRKLLKEKSNKLE